MDSPKTIDPAMSAGDSGGLVIGNVLSLSGAEDARFIDRTKIKQSENNLTPVDSIKAEFVDVPDDFLSQVDLKAEPIEPLDIKNLQLGSLINASNPGGWSNGAFAVKHEPGQHSRELTNCLIPKVEAKVEGAFHFQTVGHLQSFPKLIKGEIPDCICEPGEVNVRSNVGERLSLFELMSQSRDQNHLPNDNHMLQPKERNPVNPDLKSNVHDSMSLEPSQMLLPTHSKSSESIPESMALQQKQKPKLQCARKSTISRKVKENRSRTKPVNKDTDRSSHGIDEDTDGYQIDSDSDSGVSQEQLGRKNAGNHNGVADVETEKKQTDSVPTIPSKPQTNQLKNNKRGRKGSKARTKQPKKTADNNNEHIPEQILTISAANINCRSLNEDVNNSTQTDQSYQNCCTRSFNRSNLSQHLNCEKQPEQDGGEVGVMSDSATNTVGSSRKSRTKQKPETADANSNTPARRTTRSLRKSEQLDKDPRQIDQSDLEEDVDQNESFARQTRSSCRKATLTRSMITKKKTTEDQTSDREDSGEIDSVITIRQTKRSTAKQKFPRMERRGSVTSDTEKDVSQSESESQTRHTAISSTSNKRTNSRNIRTGKRKQVDTSASVDSGSESSSDSDAKRVGREMPTRRKRKRRKLLPERSSLNSESATDTESNDAEARKKNLRQHKKRKQNDYTSSGSDSENDKYPDSDFESQHGESKSRKLKKGSRKPRLKGQRLNDRSESDSESEALPSKQIGPHKVKSSSVRLGRKTRSSEDSELSDERNTGAESDDTLTNQSDSRSSWKKNEGRHVSKGNTTDRSDSSENDSDDTNRSEQVSLRSKRNTSGSKRPKQKDMSSDSSEDEKASTLSVSDSVEMLSDNESTGTITASPGCSLEEKYAGNVRFQPFVQLEPLPDILEMKQLPQRTPVTRKVKNNVQNSNRKSNSSKKKGAETPDVVELVDIDDGGSDIVGQSNNNEVTYEAQTPQVQDEELEFLTAASYGIYSSRSRRLAAMRLANFSMTSKRKKKQTSNTKSPVITLSEGSEWEGSEVGDSVQSEGTNDSQCGAAKEMPRSNDTDKNIESKDRVSVETAKADTTINQFPVKSKWAKVRTTCRVCMKEFASNTTYSRHFQTAHPGMKPFICKVCGKGFERRDGLKSHVSVHTDERPCVCKICGKTYKHSAHLHEHTIRCHSGKLNFICSYCGVGYISNYKLNIHVRIHTGEKPYECEICHKRFAQKIGLKSHSAVHSAERPFICQHCGKGYKAKNLLNVHMATHSDVRNYKCKICPLAFKWQQSLRDHMQNHNDERNFPCEICNFSFRRKRQLQQHMYIHSEERQFSCDICSKKFRTKKSLTTHMLIHVGEKKFECDLCHKRFYTNSHLKKHKFLHTGKRPYACKICDQRFKTTGGVSQHMMCVHPEEEMERRKTNAVGWVVVDP